MQFLYLLLAFLLVSASAYSVWNGVKQRHPSRSILATLGFLLFAALLSLVVSLSFLSTFEYGLLLLEWDEKVKGWVDWRIRNQLVLLAFVTGGLLIASKVSKEEPVLFPNNSNKKKKNFAKKLGIIILSFFALLPAITYLTLILFFHTHSANRIGSMNEAMGWALIAHFIFFLCCWWPSILIFYFFQRLRIKSDHSERFIVSLLIVTLVSFSVPNMVMLFVLAFDIMEMDYAATNVQLVYSNYFHFLGPGIGFVFAAIALSSAFAIISIKRKSV